MNKKSLFLCMYLSITTDLCASWGSIGSSVESMGESIGGFMITMGQGMSGKVPSGYDYSFQVFNGSNVGMLVDIHKSISVMGARFHEGGGASQGIAPGENTGDGFSGAHKTHLYFSLEISGGGSSYSDPHFTLAAKDDPTIYMYHCFNNAQSGAPATELLGAGYTATNAFSGRIQNKTAKQATVTYTLTGPDTRAITIPDLDPHSFNYLTIPQGYSIRPSQLVFGSSQKVIIPAEGIGQVTDAAKKASSPVTMNYVLLNDSATGAFETGIGPGNFEQPQTADVIRDISPVQCQIYNQPADQATPIGSLMAQSLPWQSVWCAYQGYGWSQTATPQGIIPTPMWQIPAGANASCFLIRPSQTSFAQNGPARFFVVRITVPETPSPADVDNAKSFLSKLMTGKLTLKGLSPTSGGKLITQATVGSVALANGQCFLSQSSFAPADSFVAYPPLSDTYLGSTVSLSSLTASKKAQLLGLELPDEVGLLEDPTTGVKGYLLVTDVLTPYGEGNGPFFYLINAPYLDLSQMLGTLSNYASLCNYQGLTPDILNQLVQTFLPKTVEQWVSGYMRNPTQVEDSVASLLVLLGKGDTNKLAQAFTSDPSFYVEVGAKKQLSPQGNALLKLFLYGPCGVSQAPTYHKAGSSFMSAQPGWPAISLSL